MPKYSKKSPNFLEQEQSKLKQAKELTDLELDLIQKRIPSVNSLSPGDMLSFSYNGSPFMALAVSNQRTGASSTIFTNRNTKNKLFSCFVVDHLSSESLRVLLSSLDKYKDYTKIASYKYITSLFGLILGKDKYRTFISTGKMSNLNRIILQEKR